MFWNSDFDAIVKVPIALPLKMSLTQYENMVNLKSDTFVVIMLLNESLTRVHSQKKPRLHFGESFALNHRWLTLKFVFVVMVSGKGCQANDHSLRLCFNICKFGTRGQDTSDHVCGDKTRSLSKPRQVFFFWFPDLTTPWPQSCHNNQASKT